MLKKILGELESEAAADEKIYKKLKCWCNTNDRETTSAIDSGKQLDTDLTSEIEEKTAASAKLSTEAKNLESDIASKQRSLDEATALRKKQLASFTQEEKELLEAISALKSAVTVLKKHHTDFVQMPHVAKAVQHVMQAHGRMLQGVLTEAQKQAVLSLTQTGSHEAYNPQSGEVFGILEQMLETFQANLKQVQGEEAKQQELFEALSANQKASIALDAETLNSKQNEEAATNEANAQAKQDLSDTEAKVASDENFLAAVRSKCKITDAEWEERQKTRDLEIAAVTKALEILSADDAHDTFARTFSASLLQESSTVSSTRAVAVKILTAASHRSQSSRMAALASSARLDSFTKVKQLIDQMVADLQKQKTDDIKHKDFCIEERQSLDSQSQENAQLQEDVKAQILSTKKTVADTKTVIGELTTEIKELNDNKNQAGVEREEENQQFRIELQDQHEAKRILTEAFNALAAGVSLVQSHHSVEQPVDRLARSPPPEGMDQYEHKLTDPKALLQTIITKLDAMTADITRGEDEAQAVYEKFLIATNKDLQAKNEALVNANEKLAKAEGLLVKLEENLETQQLVEKQLGQQGAHLHTSCDFLLKNFDLRQQAFADEILALKQAKAVLSGDQSTYLSEQ